MSFVLIVILAHDLAADYVHNGVGKNLNPLVDEEP